MENSNIPVNEARDVENGKTIAIISYITLIGWVIAYIMHSSNKTRFGAFHLRQALGLMILGFGLAIISFGLPIISWTLYSVFRLVNIGILILAIMGIVNAANGKMKAIPVVGEFFNKTFSGIN